MSEQAIETDDTIESETAEIDEGVTFDSEAEEENPEILEEDEATEEVAEAESEDPGEPSEEELEIVVEGEAEPSSTPQRKSGFYKRFNKITGERDAAKGEAEEERLRNEALEEENKLLRLRLNQDSPLKRPKAEDFDTDADYDAALEKYDETRIQEAARKVVADQIESAQGQTTRTQQRTQFEGNLREHYAQADKLKIKDFEEAEDQVVDTIGNELLQYIVNYHGDKSAAMVFHLSKNPVKAQELYDLSQDPSQAVRLAQRLTRLEDSLKIRAKRSPTANPEKEVKSGTPAVSEAIRGATFE